jgi:hypothetical protein
VIADQISAVLDSAVKRPGSHTPMEVQMRVQRS